MTMIASKAKRPREIWWETGGQIGRRPLRLSEMELVLTRRAVSSGYMKKNLSRSEK